MGRTRQAYAQNALGIRAELSDVEASPEKPVELANDCP
jgi:hypothetical protein